MTQPGPANGNPYFEKPPGRSRRAMITKSGTDEERAWLEEYLMANLSPEEREQAELQTQKKREYWQRVHAMPSDKGKPTIAESIGRMYNLMNRGVVRNTEPDPEIVNVARTLLWKAYSEVVKKGRGTAPVIEKGDHVSTVLTAATYWLIGAQAPEGVRGFDPRKSLYFAGSTGNGKSSIAKAMHFASERLASDYKVGHGIGIRSMKRVVTDILADQNLASIKDLSKGSLVLDEIRSEHITLKHYGNEISIVSDVLYNRYDSWDFDGHRTILTTNLTPAKLCEELGDERLKDRINDQYQLVKFQGKPFRDTNMSEF